MCQLLERAKGSRAADTDHRDRAGRHPHDRGFDEWYGIPRTSNEAQYTTSLGYDSTKAPLPYIMEGIAIPVLTYVMLGWGLNIVVGLAGLLDLGYVAFYAVGAYSYALLATSVGLSFWVCLPLAGLLAAMAGVPLEDVPGRAPFVLFSKLAPRT